MEWTGKYELNRSKLADGICNFPLRSTRYEHLFAFSTSALSLFPLGQIFRTGRSSL